MHKVLSDVTIFQKNLEIYILMCKSPAFQLLAANSMINKTEIIIIWILKQMSTAT